MQKKLDNTAVRERPAILYGVILDSSGLRRVLSLRINIMRVPPAMVGQN